MSRMRLALAASVAALAFTALAAPAPADAAMQGCRGVTGHPGGTATWKVYNIRLTKGFGCKRARRNIRTWIGFGGMMDHPRALAPWRCNFTGRVRCRLRTSFGGTRPMRTYRLRFSIRNV